MGVVYVEVVMNAIEKNRVWVYCGNGGDYEFENERAYWKQWMKRHMADAEYVIIPHHEGDKAWIIFEAGYNVSVFGLKAPKFITFKEAFQ